ncbi:ribbon-helix-helix protein, CopG family [Myxococcota bacterium]
MTALSDGDHTLRLKPEHGRDGPRVHDIRHAFAIHCLQRWYDGNQDVQKLLPHLCTYMADAPKDPSRPFSFRIRTKIEAALNREASRRGISRSKLIEEALEEKLFGSPKSNDLEHEKLTTLMFLEEILVGTCEQPRDKLREVCAVKQKQAADYLDSLEHVGRPLNNEPRRHELVF